MEYHDEHYTLSSGRRMYAHLGVLGLGPKDDSALYEGFDGVVFEDPDDEPDPDEPLLTPVERREIAVAMMDRWRVWAGLPDALGEIGKLVHDHKRYDRNEEDLSDLVLEIASKAQGVLVFREDPPARPYSPPTEADGYCDVCKGPCQGH